MPNKLSRFWQELKRRRVVHVLIVYATAAFAILEAADIIFPRLGLPDRTVTLVMIVLGVGFPLALIFSWIFDITPDGVEKTKPSSELKEGEKTVVSNAWKIATIVSFLVIIGLIVLNIFGKGNKLHAGDIQSLVVLPFDNYTGDDQLENVVSGMHALLVGDMGRISEVRVVGATTSNAFRNGEMTATEIATELDVDAVVETSVMCFGDTVCMQFRLVQTTGKEKQLWIANFKQDKQQMLNLNNQVTKQIADEIQIKLTPEERRLLAKSRTVDREAYDAYLQSHKYWDDLSQEGLNKALEYLNLAVEKDPDFAPSYAALAQVWDGLAQMGYVAPDVAEPKVYENLDKAIELDPDFATSHFVNACIAVWTEWNWEKGEREFKKALEINPNDAMSRIFYSHLLVILRRDDEALFHSQMAYELDPMNPMIMALSAMVEYDDNIEQAWEKSKRALEIDPENILALGAFGYASYLKEDYETSIEIELKGWPQLNDEARLDIMAVFQKKGYIEAIKTMLVYLEESAGTNYISYKIMGENYCIVGNFERAIECFMKAYELHDWNLPYVTRQFDFNQIKDDPRIISLAEKMNLPLPED